MSRQRAPSREATRERQRQRHQFEVWRLRRRLALLPVARYARELQFLRELAGRVEHNDFTTAERLQARAALVEGSPVARQRTLELGNRRAKQPA